LEKGRSLIKTDRGVGPVAANEGKIKALLRKQKTNGSRTRFNRPGQRKDGFVVRNCWDVTWVLWLCEQAEGDGGGAASAEGGTWEKAREIVGEAWANLYHVENKRSWKVKLIRRGMGSI